MEILAGILHDTYTDENGMEVPYTSKVVAVLEDDEFSIVDIPEMSTFRMPKEEFLSKVTDIQKMWSKA